MTALMERASTVAELVYDKRSLGVYDDAMSVRIALAESYTLGFVAGLEQAGDVVRIERECLQAELES